MLYRCLPLLMVLVGCASAVVEAPTARAPDPAPSAVQTRTRRSLLADVGGAPVTRDGSVTPPQQYPWEGSRELTRIQIFTGITPPPTLRPQWSWSTPPMSSYIGDPYTPDLPTRTPDVHTVAPMPMPMLNR